LARLDKQWKNRPLFQSLHGEIQGSGMSITASELVALQLGLGIALSVAVLLLVKSFGLLLVPVSMWIGVYLVRWYVRFRARRRVARFEDQLPNSLAILAGSGRGGFSLVQVLQMMFRECYEP